MSAATTTVNGSHGQAALAWYDPTNTTDTNAPAQYDFRSDVVTTPTLSMLEAIKQTSLQDDVMAEDPVTISLEAHVAALAGKEAGLLVMSGTMGNQVALRSHLVAPPHSIVCDSRSHIINYEAGGASLLSGAMQITVTPSNQHHLTVADIKAHAVISDDVHFCPTRVICLENTLNGVITPQADIEDIAAFARANGIILHLDGARVWEVAVATKTPLAELLKPFDSASLCFSKGLGAPIGSIVVGSKAFITRARHIRKVLGGGTRQAGVISAAARVAVDETFGLDPAGQTGRLSASHAQARAIGELWKNKKPGVTKLTYPVETNMVWPDIVSLGLTEQEWSQVAAKHGIKVLGPRLVVHYQISQAGVDRLEKVMDELLQLSLAKKQGQGQDHAAAKENIYRGSN